MAVGEVVGYDREKGEVELKVVKTLKGKAPEGVIRHGLAGTAGGAVARPILRWAAAGSRGVLFASPRSAVVCVGEAWYTETSVNGVWKLGTERPGLPLAYYGKVSRLAESVETMLAGNDAIITMLAYTVDNEGVSFDMALNRANLPGVVRLQRMWANTLMPANLMTAAADADFYIGVGGVDARELPGLLEKLKAGEAGVRIDAADDLGLLGKGAKGAVPELVRLLKDGDARVRVAAAGAVLRIDARNAGVAGQAVECDQGGGLDSGEMVTRRAAVRAKAGVCGGGGGGGVGGRNSARGFCGIRTRWCGWGRWSRYRCWGRWRGRRRRR